MTESTGSERKGDATRLLQQRVGARDNGLPVIPNVEKYTFDEAAQAMLDDFTNTGKKSRDEVERRIEKHLKPFFGGRRLVGIGADDIRRYVTQRKTAEIVLKALPATFYRKGALAGQLRAPAREEQRRPVSAAEINRELQTLKRIFNIALRDGKLARRPYFEMLKEDNVRTGFFEPEQYNAVLRRLPSEIRPVITFAYITGWRITSEVLPLEWRQVDFDGREVRLNAGTTKNGDGRVFYFTADLERLLRAQKAEHERLKKAGHIMPNVFFREVAEERGGEKKPKTIVAFAKAWHAACVAAGCPGRIPHDLRRTAVRNLVRAGISERVAMRLTGHKTPSVFARYNIVSDGDLREAARKLDASTTQQPRANASTRASRA
jgi:integrase